MGVSGEDVHCNCCGSCARECALGTVHLSSEEARSAYMYTRVHRCGQVHPMLRQYSAAAVPHHPEQLHRRAGTFKKF